jgi:hypothetical protein
MGDSRRYSYTTADGKWGDASLMPFLPLLLRSEKTSVSVSALIDSGATVNVLPYSIGTQLELKWEEQKTPITLGGNLARLEAKGVVLTAEAQPFPSVRLAFAWVKSDEMPTLLGQTNFFMEFNVCFYRAQESFEIQPR